MTMITSRQIERPVYLSHLKLRIPLRHKYMTRESYFGAGALPPVTAKKAAFPTTIQVADPGKMRMDKESRKRQAKSTSDTIASHQLPSASLLELLQGTLNKT
jgi:hypothetical protein